jgi:uncharacterized protein YyaL (SSP411 family)
LGTTVRRERQSWKLLVVFLPVVRTVSAMPNALIHEKSPYLLQHADNPVQWLPWGEEAFAKARAEQKPVFLSIGYSTCHWCHVMAHESFEDEAVAALLNSHFVPVKVDREERPDVDKVYMAYVQAMTGHGGWPLNAWLTPDLKPFYGGTYFPPEDRQGRAGFPSLLRAIAKGWADERDKLVAEGERVIGALRDYYSGQRDDAPSAENAAVEAGGSGVAPRVPLVEAASKAFEQGFEHFYENYDPTHGGFGGAPKFPRASNLSFLFRVAALQGVTSDMGAEAVRLATGTLQAMARGGIHDHVGGGFHRYSVDEGWFVPHFEKMLYDQAQIALNCLEARQATGDERFAWLARDVFDYVARDLTSPGGAFFTAEDADSLTGTGETAHHAEGAFYVWTADELRGALAASGEVTPPDREAEEPVWRGGEAEFPWIAAHFGVTPEGNVPTQLDPHGELRGKNILVQRRSLLDTARQAGLSPEQANEKLLAVLRHLRAVRTHRPRPGLDDKILTANNALMISALARAHQIIGSGEGSEDGEFLQRARRAASFIEQELYDGDRGVLYRTWRLGRTDTPGFAEDYAFLVQALLDLYEASFEVRWLQWAKRLQAVMDGLFWDEERGGYFNSAAGDRNIVLRLKEDYDGAEPAPSSVAAMNLLRLSVIFDGSSRGTGATPTYRERGVRCIEAFRPQWARAPHAMPQMLCALELALEPPRHVVIAGDPTQADFRALVAVLHERLGPRRSLLAADGGGGQRWLATLAPWLADMTPRDGRATAYVCEEFACQAPASDPETLRARLRGE